MATASRFSRTAIAGEAGVVAGGHSGVGFVVVAGRGGGAAMASAQSVVRGTRVGATLGAAARSVRQPRGAQNADATRRALGVRAAVTSYGEHVGNAGARDVVARIADGSRGLAARATSSVNAHRKLAFAVACALITAFALYVPLRDWYAAYRRGADLEAYYGELNSENTDISDDIARLQTREGIEDEARKRGFVGAGETAVSVVNLPEDAAGESDDVATWLPQSSSTPIEDRRNVVTRVLDFVFGYNAGAVS